MSHKTRLFLVTTIAVGVVLAIVFACIVWGVRQKVVAHKEFEMRLAVRTISRDGSESFPVESFRSLYPDYSVAIFDSAGNRRRTSGAIELDLLSGFKSEGNKVFLGETIGAERVVIGSGWTPVEQGLDALAVILASLWLPLTLLIGAATWLGAQSVFRPLERMSDQAAAISGLNLTERLAIQDRAEFGRFANQLNQMLDRIQETLEREEQFASDAAHELRTPLAILRTKIESTLLRPRTKKEYEDSLAALLPELDRLTLTVESLLRSARGIVAEAETVDLAPIIRESCERIADRFAHKKVELECKIDSVFGAILPEELGTVTLNLLDNALRFSPEASRVEVVLYKSGSNAVLEVQDDGAGVPDDLKAQIFERFFRSDDSRNRSSGGAGIGLSVCRRILESRGGSIELGDSERGARFICRIRTSPNKPAS